ncbi:MAG TPA: IS110 family transposase [Terriglobales bacterium]|nr:IS110 family transposase [Terriglobales bacterium]
MTPNQKDKDERASCSPTQPSWQQMNRKQRRETMRKIQSEDLRLEVVHPDSAGIDIGNESHYVAVPPNRDSQPVRCFGCTTAQLKAMADWLKQCGIRTIAMQSTGVYWIAVYDILEEAGLEVYLVNARETKNLPGRKSDVQESQWLMKLHTYGLLRNSFRPSQEIRTMRTYWRQRNDLVQAGARHIQRIQKALTQMNIQLANVLSDVSGMTGQLIIKAILAGERDPHTLAAFRDRRVKASEEQIARSLEGHWQDDLLFVLKQEQDGYEFCQQQMAECDRRLEQYLQQKEDRSQGASLPEEKRKGRLKKKQGNKPQVDLRTGLFRMTGVDLTQIDCIDVMTATTILSEAGWDMSKWETEHHFVSWLRLCPDNRISGDKIIGKGRLPTNNRITSALKIAATTLRKSNTYLGAQFRRLKSKLGAPIAIKAMAAKLARLVYRMLRYGMKYVDQGAAFYQAQHRNLQIKYLKSKAAKLGFQIVQAPAA